MDYTHEVPHSELLVVQGREPFNAEPRAAALVEFAVTPEDLVYCRNHGPVLELDDEQFCLSVNGLVSQAKMFNMQELRSSFPRHEVIAALQVEASSTSAQSRPY